MEESGGFKMISKKETPNLPANSSLLALFWTLAEGKEEKRFEATQSMVKILSAKQGSVSIFRKVYWQTCILMQTRVNGLSPTGVPTGVPFTGR